MSNNDKELASIKSVMKKTIPDLWQINLLIATMEQCENEPVLPYPGDREVVDNAPVLL